MLPRFCFTLDTEPDDLWGEASRLTFDHFEGLPRFHETMVSVGARPTYLTTSEVVEDPRGLAAIMACLEHGSCEIGAHYHTWTREWPFETPHLGSPPVKAMAHQLGSDIEQQMLRYTCAAIQHATGLVPMSYRGGRWSLGPGSVGALAACGVTVDSTVTPGISWRRSSAGPLLDGPDFTRAPRVPYYLATGQDVTTARAAGEVLEIPVGTAWTPALSRAASGWGLGRRILKKVSAMLPVGYTWLRPLEQTPGQLAACLRQLRRDGAPVWVAMIHSSEIGRCRRLPKQEDVDGLVRRCTGMTEMAISLGAVGSTLQQAAQCVSPQPN